jgi:hypothetical protein
MRTVLIIVAFLIANISFGQSKYSCPESYFDIGLGIGPNYGIYGAKAIIGKNGTGLLLGAGSYKGKLGWELGLQGSYKWWFANIGAGVYGTSEYKNGIKDLLEGIIFITGAKLNIKQQKRFFVEFGIGYSTGEKIVINKVVQMISSPVAIAGINYRIPPIKFNHKRKK